jgi:hypothetical protein
LPSPNQNLSQRINDSPVFVTASSGNRELESAPARTPTDRDHMPAHRMGARRQRMPKPHDYSLLVGRVVTGLLAAITDGARPVSESPLVMSLTRELASRGNG